LHSSGNGLRKEISSSSDVLLGSSFLPFFFAGAIARFGFAPALPPRCVPPIGVGCRASQPVQ
jgi:hypothetical protein